MVVLEQSLASQKDAIRRISQSECMVWWEVPADWRLGWRAEDMEGERGGNA